MSANVYDFVRETSTTVGTGATISLTAITGFSRFADVAVVGTKVYYSILSGNDREVGIGTIQASNTFSRDTPLTTLVGGVYNKNPLTPISMNGDSEVAITPLAQTLTTIEEEVAARILLLIGT